MIVKTGSFVDWPLWKVQNSREENFLYCAALLGWLLIYLLYYLLPNAQGRIYVCKFLSNNNWIVNIFISFGGSVHCYPIIKGLERLVKQMFFFQKKIFTSYKLKRFSFPFNKHNDFKHEIPPPPHLKKKSLYKPLNSLDSENVRQSWQERGWKVDQGRVVQGPQLLGLRHLHVSQLELPYCQPVLNQGYS